MVSGRTSWLSPAAQWATDLAALVLPDGCAGCGAVTAGRRYGACPDCVSTVTRLRPYATRPDPAPTGLPPCAALGPYQGVLRELLLAYKDRGRYRLAAPLGRLLAQVVAHALGEIPGPVRSQGPVVLVPVPDTPAAARSRHGDHLWRLARPAAARLRQAGLRVTLARPLRARPRPDSAGLDSRRRLVEARAAMGTRSRHLASLRRRVAGAYPRVVLLDDIVTTGATLAAAADRLAAAGVPVSAGAVLAATPRRVRRASAGEAGCRGNVADLGYL